MVAALALDEVHVTNAVRSCVSPLLKVPRAFIGVSKPAATFAFCGVTCIEVNVADSTSRLAVTLSEPSCAVIVTAPADWPVANPARLIPATLVFDEVQVANPFRFSTVPSVKVPSAVNCSPEAGAISAVVGVRVRELSVAELTVSPVVPVALAPLALKAAFMVALPALTPTANPLLPAVLETVAIAVLFELQVTCPVMVWVDESLKVPVALNF